MWKVSGVQTANNGNDLLLVDFPRVGIVPVDRKTWYKYDENGKILGSRTQYPLSLCYVKTIRKAQSLTIYKTVIVHCSQEFIPGQTYIALSRVRREATFQVIGFRKRFLLPPPSSLSDVMSFPLETVMPTFECRNKREISQVFCEMDNTSVPFLAKNEIVAETFCEDPKEHFESNTGDGVELSLEDVLLYVMDHNKKLSSPPRPNFLPKSFWSL